MTDSSFAFPVEGGEWITHAGRQNGKHTRQNAAIGAMATATLALQFGEIARTGVLHADQTTPESDAEHTVALGWIAPALAEALFPDLDQNLVAAFALVHDAPELYAGDTPTIQISAEERAAKEAREAAAVDQLDVTLGSTLPWLPRMVRRYETQEEPEARFVKLVDKLCPKFVHLVDSGAGLRQQNVTRDEFQRMAVNQRRQLFGYFQEFPHLWWLHVSLCASVEALLA